MAEVQDRIVYLLGNHYLIDANEYTNFTDPPAKFTCTP